MNIKDVLYKIPVMRRLLFSIIISKRKKIELQLAPVLCGKGENIYHKDIYIIRWNNPSAGLFAYVLNIMGEIWYAQERGYVPVVDMQSEQNTYLYKELVGKENAWNYFFNSIGEISLDECKKYRNVYVGYGKGQLYSPCPSVGWMTSKKEITHWQNMAQKYLSFTPKAMEYCMNSFSTMISDSDRVLGVKCRGTDYNSVSAKGHPIQPSVDKVITKADKIMHKFGCNKLYLSTEDKTIIEVFREHYGDKLIVSSSHRVDYDMNLETCVSLYSTGRENDKYLQGLEYIRDVYILSKCTCLIGGINGGSAAALMMGRNFEYTYFWYLGRY